MLPFLNTCRKIDNPEGVRFIKQGPWGGVTKLKGARAKGKTFERTVARHLSRVMMYEHPEIAVIHNQWIEYIQENKVHYCQPDILLISPDKVIIIETKLTQSLCANDQLFYLYAPLIKRLYPDKKVFCIMLCKNVKIAPKYEVRKIVDIFNLPFGNLYTLQSRAIGLMM